MATKKITVTFPDGSGWVFSLPNGSHLWYMDDVHPDGTVDTQTGIIANDHRKSLIAAALDAPAGVSIVVTRED